MNISADLNTVSYSTTSTSDSSSSSTDLSSSDFMTLLIAQLENQDPLNPLEDTDMLAELAQFSNLEQLVSVNETLESLTELVTTQAVNSAVSYIGYDVTAEGDSISVSDGSASDITYTLESDAAEATADIYDSDDNLVASVSLTDLEEGDQTFTWDGLDSDGNQVEDGTYYVEISAYDENGDSISASTQCSGTVVGLTSVDGTTVFELDDGRYVSMANVSEVRSPYA